MNTSCSKCRALEYIDSGIRVGKIVSLKLHDPRYNCALGQRIILLEDEPHCDGECKWKTTKRIKN